MALFLAGLVVLGGQQQWWLQPFLIGMSQEAVFFGATILTAFTDNAALTYLGSLVEGLSEGFKYALVAGAVTGGGLTVISQCTKSRRLGILQGQWRTRPLYNPTRIISRPATTVSQLWPFVFYKFSSISRR